MRILVWHPGALGDLVLSFPALWAIRRHSGEATLHVCSRTDLSGIITANDLADHVSSHETGFFSELFIGGRSLPAWGEKFLADFDTAFVFMRHPDACFLKNLQKYIPRCFSIRTVPPDGVRMLVSDFRLAELRTAGIDGECPMPALKAPGNVSVSLPDKKIVALHPGSGGRKKCWPLDRFLTLVSSLRTKDAFHLCVLLGAAEGEDTIKCVEHYVREEGRDASILRNAPLQVVAEALRRSSLYVGNDSGMTHLASVLGTPTIAVFGPTDPLRWGPKGNVRIVCSHLECAPCGETDYRKCGDARCMRSVTVEDVCVAARQLLAADGAGSKSGRPLL